MFVFDSPGQYPNRMKIWENIKMLSLAVKKRSQRMILTGICAASVCLSGVALAASDKASSQKPKAVEKTADADGGKYMRDTVLVKPAPDVRLSLNNGRSDTVKRDPAARAEKIRKIRADVFKTE